MLSKLFRLLLSAILCLFLVGFGVCGAMGVVGGFSGDKILSLPLGLLGIAIAWSCGYAIRGLWRKRSPSAGT